MQRSAACPWRRQTEAFELLQQDRARKSPQRFLGGGSGPADRPKRLPERPSASGGSLVAGLSPIATGLVTSTCGDVDDARSIGPRDDGACAAAPLANRRLYGKCCADSRRGVPHSVSLRHRARQTQMRNRLCSLLDESWGSGHLDPIAARFCRPSDSRRLLQQDLPDGDMPSEIGSLSGAT